MIRQYTNDSDSYEDGGSELDSKKILYVVGVVILLIAVISAFFIFKSPSEQNTVCGDSVCDNDEDCRNCLKDCPCKTDEICKDRICVKKEVPKEVCGNGKCESGENEDNCCDDCPCTAQNTVCNTKTHKCESKVTYGDGACDSSENCWDHPKDCKCKEGEHCSLEDKKCLKSTCGDNVCDPTENSGTCCEDCPCISEGEVCNKETHSCEFPISLTDERAEELAIKYFEEKGNEVLSAELLHVGLTEEKEVAKYILVRIKDYEFTQVVHVTEDETVREERVH